MPVYQLDPDPSRRSDFDNLMRLLSASPERKLPDVALTFLGVVRDLVNQGRDTEWDDAPAVDDMIEKSCFDFNRAFDKRIDLKVYCRENGWGYESFRKRFKQAIGESPGSYIVRRRLDEACRLLRATHMRIAEISTELGYKSQYEFSNQFKRQFGVFPTRFRDGTEGRPAVGRFEVDGELMTLWLGDVRIGDGLIADKLVLDMGSLTAELSDAEHGKALSCTLQIGAANSDLKAYDELYGDRFKAAPYDPWSYDPQRYPPE